MCEVCKKKQATRHGPLKFNIGSKAYLCLKCAEYVALPKDLDILIVKSDEDD